MITYSQEYRTLVMDAFLNKEICTEEVNEHMKDLYVLYREYRDLISDAYLNNYINAQEFLEYLDDWYINFVV